MARQSTGILALNLSSELDTAIHRLGCEPVVSSLWLSWQERTLGEH